MSEDRHECRTAECGNECLVERNVIEYEGGAFYLPLALVIPPAQFVMHHQFSYLYMFWIHTEAIKSLGPLEYILNTPSHHRVHHGSNKYCLDVNYGGVLIIWDRLFGTFRPETDKVEIVYGLIYNQPSFNPLYLQCHRYNIS
uniref:Fatty acid hydroxylase domain-containing protein n=1 Tax=Heliothis virescens TaxID=7102 RepID=A0A2A4ITT9_HELVI